MGEAGVGGMEQAEMALPSLEDDLDAPAQAIDLAGGLDGQAGGGSVGQQKSPAKQVIVEGIMAEATVAIKTSLAAALIGECIGHRQSEQTNRGAVA